MKKRKALGMIVRNIALFFVLINALLLVCALVFHVDALFGFSLSVICPILGGILSYLVERIRWKQDGGRK